jgi:hypothetical protein
MRGSSSVRFVVQGEEDPDWPDPIRTHVFEHGEVLRAFMASLEPEQPLVIAPEAGDTIDIASCWDLLREAESAGRDVVITLPRA